MRLTQLIRCGLVTAALLALAGPAQAIERWGKVESVNARFQKFVLVQEGSDKEYEVRVNGDTSYVLRDGRTAGSMDLARLKGQRIYAIVEENPGRYANKIWLRPNVAPDHDPVNPGVGVVVH